MIAYSVNVFLGYITDKLSVSILHRPATGKRITTQAFP
jgi:hypothetical protein